MNIGTMAGGFMEKGLLCRTTTYNKQYRRPLHGNFGQNVMQLKEITGGHDFSRERLAGIASTSLLPAVQNEGEALIENDWGTERCLFAFKIVHQSNQAGTNRMVQYLQGYTSHMGIHHGQGGIVGVGAHMPIDPMMRLYFNSSLMFQEHTTVNAFGQRQTTVTPVETSQLLAGTPASLYGTNTYTLRPEDLYSTIHAQELVSSVNRYTEAAGPGGVTPNASLLDTRVTFQSGQPLKKSSRSNLIPSAYLSRLLTSPSGVMAAYADEPHISLANKISGSLCDGYMTNDVTLSAMLERTGLAENCSITYGELCSLFQNADGTIIRLGMETQTVQGSAGHQSEYFHGGSWALLIAQMLQNVTTALLVETSLRSVIVRGDNFSGGNMLTGELGGQFKVEVLGGGSFVDGRPVEYSCEVLRNRLIQEFLAGYTGHNYVPIGFTMKIDLYTESVIDITYNHEPLTRFVSPVFGDSLFSPMLTNNPATLTGLSAETRAMTHNLLNIL